MRVLRQNLPHLISQKLWPQMLSPTLALLKGQYQTRLKTRMVGFIPKVNFRKLRGNMVALRSEANTGFFEARLKTEEERLAVGRKLSSIAFDPVVQRYVVTKEVKVKGPFLTKAHIVAKKPDHPSQLK